MATLSELTDITYRYLNDTPGSFVYPIEDVQQVLNDEQLELASRKKWQFLVGQQQFTYAGATTLSSDLPTASLTAAVGGTVNFPTAGALYVNRDVILYTGTTSLSFTGLTGQSFDHEEGDTVEQLSVMNSNYLRAPELSFIPNGASRWCPIEYTPYFQFDADRKWRKYTIVTEGNNNYIYCRGLSNGDRINLYYVKKPTVMASDSDVCDFPDDWAKKILPKLAAYKLKFINNDNLEGEAQDMKNIADLETARMFKVWGIREEGMSKLMRTDYQSRIMESSPQMFFSN